MTPLFDVIPVPHGWVVRRRMGDSIDFLGRDKHWHARITDCAPILHETECRESALRLAHQSVCPVPRAGEIVTDLVLMAGILLASIK